MDPFDEWYIDEHGSGDVELESDVDETVHDDYSGLDLKDLI